MGLIKTKNWLSTSKLAKKAGLDAIVACAQVKIVKYLKKKLLHGIRFGSAEMIKEIVTKQAGGGSDWLVLGDL